MAITSNKISSMLQLKVKTGTDHEGNDITALQSYRKVKIDAAEQDVYDVAQVLGSYQTTPLVGVLKTDSFELINEA
ncbi:hypothetical protein OXPF_18060 [Oxobacter pfennigii]|uniref:DUF1659 domain-containing protein n=1 Tax=Oxobacter pfennigii TaxID=36849 RepID=A0A0N8NTF9_9CLOT|nr:DUF1659 domain-containing protein [Oxobacter pfennigii]KPU44720.1 hypothetical protein OXPF_18060 [Oxobacter pfennigii]